MTIEERLCFIRAGYSAQDIARFEASESQADPPAADQADQPAADQADPAPADPAPAPADQAPAWVTALNNTLDELRRTIQAGNARFDDMGDDTDVIDSAEAALQQYLTGKAPEKTQGGKRK